MSDILFNTCAVANDKMWFVSVYGNLMNMDITTRRVSFVIPENVKSNVGKPAQYKILVNDGDLYWVEYDLQHLVRYSITKNKCRFYKLPLINNEGGECLAGVTIYEKKIYFFPRYTPNLIIFDIISEEFIVQDLLFQVMGQEAFANRKEFLFRSTQSNDTIFFLQRENGNANTIIKYDIGSGNYGTIILPEEIENPVNICCGKNCLYILCADTSLYRASENYNKIEKLYMSENTNESFLSIAVSERSLFLLPSRSENIKEIDLETLYVRNFNNYPDNFKYVVESGSRISKYYGYCESGKYLWYANRTANYILRINKERNLIEWIKPELPTLSEIADYYIKIHNEIVFNESRFGIRMLIESICQNQKKQNRGTDVFVGTDIWKKIIKK